MFLSAKNKSFRVMVGLALIPVVTGQEAECATSYYSSLIKEYKARFLFSTVARLW